jgi:hypothetical protein
VPVLNERLLYNILGAPHHKDLRTAYLVAKKRAYLPSSRVHFQGDQFRAEFGEVTFVGEGFGVRLLRHWDPVTDTNFFGLDSTS